MLSQVFRVNVAESRANSFSILGFVSGRLKMRILSGRIDRKIEFPYPDEKTKRKIFQIHTGRMNLADDVNLDPLITSKDELSGADVKVCLSVEQSLFTS